MAKVPPRSNWPDFPQPEKETAGIGQGTPGPGRPKGIPNKTTTLLKEAIVLAATEVGEDGNGKAGLVGYCKFLATSEPKAFAALMGRVIPVQVTGEDGAALQVQIVRFADPAS